MFMTAVYPSGAPGGGHCAILWDLKFLVHYAKACFSKWIFHFHRRLGCFSSMAKKDIARHTYYTHTHTPAHAPGTLGAPSLHLALVEYRFQIKPILYPLQSQQPAGAYCCCEPLPASLVASPCFPLRFRKPSWTAPYPPRVVGCKA